MKKSTIDAPYPPIWESINPDPSGLGRFPRHTGGSISVLSDKWRAEGTITHYVSSTPHVADIIEFIHTPRYYDNQFLHQKYVAEGLSIAQIASQIVSSKEAVRNGLKRAGIAIREAHRPHGRPAQPRFGEKVVKGKAQPHLAEKRVIKAVMDLRAQGLTLRQIAKFLDQIGVPTKCRGKGWHPQMVARIIAAIPPNPASDSTSSDTEVAIQIQNAKS